MADPIKERHSRMDRVAVISDVHGNVTASRRSWPTSSTGITRILNLGDVIGKGPRGSRRSSSPARRVR